MSQPPAATSAADSSLPPTAGIDSSLPPLPNPYDSPESGSSGPPQITDSPWFWAYLFGVCALIGLVLAVPKYGERQSQIERSYQGRQRAAQQQHDQEPNVPMSSPANTLITLYPLFVAVGILSICAWIMLWRTHRQKRAAWLLQQTAQPPPAQCKTSPSGDT